MALPENDFLGRLGAVIEQRGLPSEGKKALIAEAGREPAGKPSAKDVVQKTTEIMQGLEPMISEESLAKVGLSKGDNPSRAREAIQRAADGKQPLPSQYDEANNYLTKLGEDLRGRKELAELSYEKRIEEALRILREQETEEPMSWGEITGRIALATAPALIGAIMGPGIGAGAGKGIMYGLEEADKRKEKKKERLREITELGVKAKLEKEGAKIKGLAELEQEAEKSKAKLPLSYAEAAATLQQLGARGLQGMSQDERNLYYDLLKIVVPKLMEGDKEGKLAEEKPTVGQQAIDRSFAKQYADYLESGGSSAAMSNIGLLENSIKEMAESDMVSGPRVQFLPDMMNPKGTRIRQNIEASIEGTLRQVLGASYTEREGERVLSRAFNPGLEEAENIERARRTMNNLRLMVGLKDQAIKYFEEKGTLKGFKGTDLFDKLYSEIKGETPEVVRPDVVKRVDPKTGKVFEYRYNPKTGKYE